MSENSPLHLEMMITRLFPNYDRVSSRYERLVQFFDRLGKSRKNKKVREPEGGRSVDEARKVGRLKKVIHCSHSNVPPYVEVWLRTYVTPMHGLVESTDVHNAPRRC